MAATYETMESSQVKSIEVDISWAVGAQFGVVVADQNAQELRLPPKFSKEMPFKFLCESHLIHENATWKVQLESGRAMKAVYITSGWHTFAKDVRIRDNSLLVFKHLGKLNFEVTYMKIYTGQNFTCFQERRNRKLCSPQLTDKVNFEDRQHLFGKAVLEKAEVHPPDMEMFDVVPIPFERKMNGHRKKQLTIPSEFVKDAKLQGHAELMLVQLDSPRSARPVRLVHLSGGPVRMGQGWPVFYRQQNLQAGDLCTFSLDTHYTHPKMVYVNVSIKRKIDGDNPRREHC